MRTGGTCYCDLCVETAATLCKPWVRLDGGAYTENQIKQRGEFSSETSNNIIFPNADSLIAKAEQYETSSRSSPSKTRDTRIYCLEFCKASLIRDKKISENITTPKLDRILQAGRSSDAPCIPIFANLPHSTGTYSSLAHQNLWLVLENEIQSWPRAACSEVEYNQKVLGIVNEFHFRDEHLAETHPDGYETHGHEMLKPSEVVSGLGLQGLRRQDTPKEELQPDAEQLAEGHQLGGAEGAES
ncbi:hypothetical protein ACO22_00892 [Paracoccidioides brasiliensis]|uniref:Uncharacterized protein n=1 Tax=Paracoccidioides brasiliensis TaxID=121759 RepID=A0A1D2JNF5_PARBR|nr:hypothetical protein ACO22_00892 [Paracoccidioides brasiliensis]